MQIAGYEFEQPYVLRTTRFNDVAAVYIIYAVLNGKTVCLDVGETDKLGERISNHERKDCWEKNSSGSEIYVGVIQSPSEYQRRNIESELRTKLLPICGEK